MNQNDFVALSGVSERPNELVLGQLPQQLGWQGRKAYRIDQILDKDGKHFSSTAWSCHFIRWTPNVWDEVLGAAEKIVAAAIAGS